MGEGRDHIPIAACHFLCRIDQKNDFELNLEPVLPTGMSFSSAPETNIIQSQVFVPSQRAHPTTERCGAVETVRGAGNFDICSWQFDFCGRLGTQSRSVRSPVACETASRFRFYAPLLLYSEKLQRALELFGLRIEECYFVARHCCCCNIPYESEEDTGKVLEHSQQSSGSNGLLVELCSHSFTLRYTYLRLAESHHAARSQLHVMLTLNPEH